MNDIPKIKSAITVSHRSLAVLFSNRVIKIYDITPLIETEMFRPLTTYAFFKSVQVDTGGYGVYWNADIDISEYALWTDGADVPKSEYPSILGAMGGHSNEQSE